MAILQFSNTVSVKEILSTFYEFVGEDQRTIWPWFEIKAVIVRNQERVWQCLHLGITGCFDKHGPLYYNGDYFRTLRFCQEGTLFWQWLGNNIRNNLDKSKLSPFGDIDLALPDGEWRSPSYAIYSESPGQLIYGFPDISHSTQFWLMWLRGSGYYHSINRNGETTLLSILKEEIERISNADPMSFLAKQLSINAPLSLSQCALEVVLPFPIWLRKESHKFGSNSSDVEINSRAPFRPEDFDVSYYEKSVTTPIPSVRVPASTERNGEFSERIEVPLRQGHLVLKHQLFGDRSLVFDFEDDPLPFYLRSIIGLIYNQRDFRKGTQRWEKDLLAGKGVELEIAFVNNVARFGWAAFFTGAMANSGPQTEGIDVAILLRFNLRVLVVSLTGLHESDIQEIRNKVRKIAGMTSIIQSELQAKLQVQVKALVLCNNIPESKANPYSTNDVRVVGSTWIKGFFETDDRLEAERMIWDYNQSNWEEC